MMKNQIPGETDEVTRTTRDMFAMAALPSIIEFDLAHLTEFSLKDMAGLRFEGMFKKQVIAKRAFEYADAMMAERAKPQ